MNGQLNALSVPVATKIARLVEERGWSQEEFARQAGLSRQTVHEIMLRSGVRRLRNGTVRRCAQSLGLSVNELRTTPLDELLTRMNDAPSASGGAPQARLYEQATQPELQAWIERNRDRAARLLSEEMDELLSLQGTGGPLTVTGVEHYVKLIERKRLLLEQVHAVAGTEYLDVLEQFVSILYEKVQPYRERGVRET